SAAAAAMTWLVPGVRRGQAVADDIGGCGCGARRLRAVGSLGEARLLCHEAPSAHISGRWARSGDHGALAGSFVEAQAGLGTNGILSRKGLPALDRDIDEAGLDLQRVGPAADALCCQDGRPGPTEDVKHDVAA